MNPPGQQSLAPPGAGLPERERRFLSIAIRGLSLVTDREKAMAKFNGEAAVLLELAEAIPEGRGRKPVLTRRFTGMEDSSRFWSPYMVLHHLVIVDLGILALLSALSSGTSSGREVRTAEVKPSADTGPEIIPVFRESVANWNTEIPKLGMNSRVTHPHPWFGPLTARRWLCLAGIHHGLHRKQLEEILGT